MDSLCSVTTFSMQCIAFESTTDCRFPGRIGSTGLKLFQLDHCAEILFTSPKTCRARIMINLVITFLQFLDSTPPYCLWVASLVLAKKVSKLHPKKYSSPYPSPPQIVFDLRLGKQCNLRDLWQCNGIVENWAETRITTSKRMLHGERELQDSVQWTNSSDTG